MITLKKEHLPHAFVVFVMVLGLIMSLMQKTASPVEVGVSTQAQSQTTSTIAVTPQVTTTLPVVKWPDTVVSNALVTKVVDGDTVDVLLDDQTTVTRLRLLGINTPETVDPRKPVQCFGHEASNHMKELVSNKRIFVVADPQADDHDKYGRTLRALVLEDGMDVNATMVAQGYAYAYLDFPLNKQRKALLRHLQTEAQTNGLGLWSAQTCNGQF